MIIERIFMRHRRIDEITGCGVQHALRLAGGTGRVEDEERILGLHLCRRTIRLRLDGFLVIPKVTAGFPGDLAAGAAHDEDVLDRDLLLGGDLDRRIGIFLQRNGFTTAHAFVAGDDEGGFAIDDAAAERFGRKAAEDDGMHRTDAGASEHRIGRLRDHRHIDGDAIALLDAVLL
ncbi:hypothetical protein RHSP_76207 [Rhizobium freirei PRF 81]|uniref:Uncharacterized protein n=1 Tax=Rhizobium freirei PRF 81 TaxID=363754 RepID=N6TUY9_9HYPH|nr:hypothetical protein RHSP_76207 [Rhizobium freirei PRF 81]